MMGFNESDKLCWKKRYVVFKQLKKGIYIIQSMSASQYKLTQNTEIYAHIVAS